MRAYRTGNIVIIAAVYHGILHECSDNAVIYQLMFMISWKCLCLEKCEQGLQQNKGMSAVLLD